MQSQFEQTRQRALEFDLTDVKRSYSRRYGLASDAVALHERELKRYLVLCALHPEREHAMFSEIDNLWHEFICFTRKYHKFCHQVAGRYIHHAPREAEGAPSASALALGRIHTVEDYTLYFGAMDPGIWPAATAADCSPQPSCSEPACTSDGPESIGLGDQSAKA